MPVGMMIFRAPYHNAWMMRQRPSPVVCGFLDSKEAQVVAVAVELLSDSQRIIVCPRCRLPMDDNPRKADDANK